MKKNLLYISPIMPNFNDMGLSKRAFVSLYSLSKPYDVTLLCLLEKPGAIPEEVSRLCRNIHVLNVNDLHTRFFRAIKNARNENLLVLLRMLHSYPFDISMWSSCRAGTIEESIADTDFQYIHCFRLKTASVGIKLKARMDDSCRVVLDLDDSETKTHARYTELFRSHYGRLKTLLNRTDTMKFHSLERKMFPKFSTIFVCSENDAQELGAKYPSAKFSVVGNAIDMKPKASRPENNRLNERQKAPRLLFVGQMTSPPNRDAACWFLQNVFPELKRQYPEISLHLVGRISQDDKETFSKTNGVVVYGFAKDLAAHYRASDVAVVPIRTGGGTRIKILEAFSYQCPVVATSIGAEGIGCEQGKHILLADTPRDFFDRIVELLQVPEKAESIADNAYDFVEANYSIDVIADKIARSYNEIR